MTISVATLIYMVQLLLGEMPFLFSLPRRKHFIPRFIIAVSSCILLALFFPKSPKNISAFLVSLMNFSRYFGLLSITIVAFYFCFDSSIYAIITFAVAGYSIQHCSNRFTNLMTIIAPIFKGVQPHQLAVVLRAIVYSLPVILILGVIFCVPIYRHRYFNTGDKRLNILAGIILLSGMGITRVGDFLTDKNNDYVILESLYGMLMAIVSLIVMFTLFRSIEREKEAYLTRQLLREQKEEYRARKDSIDVINIKSHDLKHILSIYKNGGKMSSEQIEELEHALDAYDSTLKTGNPTLDICLYEKLVLCQEKKIDFTFLADGKAVDFLYPEEIYSLFGNLLDNAMNAVSELEEGKRVISLSLKREFGLALIHVENYCQGTVDFRNGLPIRKDADAYHGFGTQSIAMTAKKHGGNVICHQEGEVFSIDVSLRIPE